MAHYSNCSRCLPRFSKQIPKTFTFITTKCWERFASTKILYSHIVCISIVNSALNTAKFYGKHFFPNRRKSDKLFKNKKGRLDSKNVGNWRAHSNANKYSLHKLLCYEGNLFLKILIILWIHTFNITSSGQRFRNPKEKKIIFVLFHLGGCLLLYQCSWNNHR